MCFWCAISGGFDGVLALLRAAPGIPRSHRCARSRPLTLKRRGQRGSASPYFVIPAEAGIQRGWSGFCPFRGDESGRGGGLSHRGRGECGNRRRCGFPPARE